MAVQEGNAIDEAERKAKNQGKGPGYGYGLNHDYDDYSKRQRPLNS